MNLTDAIVHKIDKAAHSTSANLQLRTAPWTINADVIALMTDLRKLYNEKTSQGYGVFHGNQTTFPFSLILDKQYNNHISFVDFSREVMEILKKEICKSTAATGSYVFFARYSEAGDDYVVVASLKQKGGLDFDASLDVKKGTHIDLDKLHEMARINLSGWKSGADRYLSFVKKRASDDDASIYFRDFIGCAEFTASKVLTDELVVAIKDFCEDNRLTGVDRQKVRALAHQYLEDVRSTPLAVVDLDILSTIIEPANPQKFTTFLNSIPGKYSITTGFRPDKQAYKKLRRISTTTKELNISFDADMIGKTVSFDATRNELTIRNIPQSLADQIIENT